MDSEKLLEIIKLYRSVRNMLGTFGVNYEEVDAAVDAAEAEGREFGAEDAQVFIDQAESAVDRL